MVFLRRVPYFIYRCGVMLAAGFNPKAKAWIRGRRSIQKDLEGIQPSDRLIWMHSASLGEFEMGKPVLTQLKAQFPGHKILGSFFSPSGYEQRKSDALLDFACYLPHDQKEPVANFLRHIHPDLAIIVKYEFWPEMLDQLVESKIQTAVISATFRKGQFLFSPLGAFILKRLKQLPLIAVQDPDSQKLLLEKGFENVHRTGDSRFDNVLQIAKSGIHFPEIETFINKRKTFVAGSCWEADAACFFPLMMRETDMVFIMVPHDVSENNVLKLLRRSPVPAFRWSERHKVEQPEEYRAVVIDQIGLLASLYKLADFAFVGGGFSGGLHNILEPASHGVPVFFGPKHDKFWEAKAMIRAGGAVEIRDAGELTEVASILIANEPQRLEMARNAAKFVVQNAGAAKKTAALLAPLLVGK